MHQPQLPVRDKGYKMIVRPVARVATMCMSIVAAAGIEGLVFERCLRWDSLIWTGVFAICVTATVYVCAVIFRTFAEAKPSAVKIRWNQPKRSGTGFYLCSMIVTAVVYIPVSILSQEDKAFNVLEAVFSVFGLVAFIICTVLILILIVRTTLNGTKELIKLDKKDTP
jgi:hypothetical protein